ncbi:MAG TPA: hypothetical protein ENJ60_03530 [Aeromonadales bacterium]|nr:hypothetical protein [Aeromonadales bacterium]
MKKLMRTFFLLLLLSLIIPGGSTASAREHKHKGRHTETSQAIISKGQAISAVKGELRGKVLSVRLIPSEGPPVYRVKILLSKGRVRTVFVDGFTAQVIRIR